MVGAPVVVRVPVRPAIARAVDAGVLAARLPEALAGPAGQILDFIARPCPGGPGPAEGKYRGGSRLG